MALAEDAATVLDEFIHDFSNLPGEIAHYLEEIMAKDRIVVEKRQAIHSNDRTLQQHVKQHGGHVKHPKEEELVQQALANYDAALQTQSDKIYYAAKACDLVDRQVKRLDTKIRALQNEGSMPEDPMLPSLLHASAANLVEASRSGVSTPRFRMGTPTLVNLSNGVANAAIARMASAAAAAQVPKQQAPVATMQPAAVVTPVPVVTGPRTREDSAGAPDAKRRRFNGNLGTLPVPSSNLARSSSTGPGTPKAGTPGSRAGSVGANLRKQAKRPPGPGISDHPLRKRLNHGPLSKQQARRLKNSSRASPSTGDDHSDGSGSGDDNVSQSHGHDGADEDEAAEPGVEDEGDDNELYCICRNPSHGAMVACDNANCRNEWFHYECVGLKEEPKGKWLCPECRKLPTKDIKMSK